MLWHRLHKACDEIEALTYMKLDVNKAKEKIIQLANSLTLEEFAFLRARLDRLRQRDYISQTTAVFNGQSKKLRIATSDFYNYEDYDDDVDTQSKGVGRDLPKIRLIENLLQRIKEERKRLQKNYKIKLK